MAQISNQVLTADGRRSQNFYQSDRILRHHLAKHLPDAALSHMNNNLERLGSQAATAMDDLSLKADKHGPVLKKRSKYGETINEVEFHPAYWQLMHIAAQSEMFYVKYDPELRHRLAGSRHQLGFAAGQLYAMSELGVYCPLCMTDGAAHLVDKFAPPEIKERLLSKLSAREGELLYTGAMFLTEKSGGSDVGRNLATAEKIEGNHYKLNGEKWFCSNVNADVIMALARTGDVEAGTRGLSLFLVEKILPDGNRNSMNIIRLKDKLGVRSMATGEVEFQDTTGIRLGEENRGFKVMAEMINISRTYNSVAAVAGSRRAIIEAWQYLNHRIIFGKRATEHALIRQKFHELGSRWLADFLLVWRAIRAMDATGQGSEEEQQLMRILVPMAKWRSAEQSVYMVRECMELMGGNGYIEDFVMPKLLRDVNVLPIWEGSGNIIVLDMLRAAEKSNGLHFVINQIKSTANLSDSHGNLINRRLDELLATWNELKESDDRDVIEATAKPLFKEFIELYQMALMIREHDEENEAWIEPALDYMQSRFSGQRGIQKPIGLDRLEDLIG
ncbi:MAG: acyl-CoA dehydrogenase family protein, partial [Balneolaceae bacterium]|nr:acyl-CoA dehydrogenase family protein [Balneolaceae bacterium]